MIIDFLNDGPCSLKKYKYEELTNIDMVLDRMIDDYSFTFTDSSSNGDNIKIEWHMSDGSKVDTHCFITYSC